VGYLWVMGRIKEVFGREKEKNMKKTYSSLSDSE
jgi:hypothetical protein